MMGLGLRKAHWAFVGTPAFLPKAQTGGSTAATSPDLAFLQRPPAIAGDIAGTKNVPSEGGHLQIYESSNLSIFDDTFASHFFVFSVFGGRKVFDEL